MRTETRRGGRKKTSMTYNRFQDDFLIDKIKPDETDADMVGDLVVGDLVDQEWQIIDDDKSFWQENHSGPEREMDVEECEAEKREHTNLRILEWL